MWMPISLGVLRHGNPPAAAYACWVDTVSSTGPLHRGPQPCRAEKQSSGALPNGATHALGFCFMARDLELPLFIILYSDAVAAVGIARRRGIGRFRHLSTTDLSFQEKLLLGKTSLVNADGKTNSTDAFTNYVPRPLLGKHLRTLGLCRGDGRADAAPKLVVAPSY